MTTSDASGVNLDEFYCFQEKKCIKKSSNYGKSQKKILKIL